jgi:hypothetical protein
MYTKHEISRQRQAFWTAFGQYMKPVLSADGEQVNWVNYKTGIADLYFRMYAGHHNATIAIVCAQSDPDLQQYYYQQLAAQSLLLHQTLGEQWQWQPLTTDEFGKTISTVGTELRGVNIALQQDWPQLIDFFKQRIMALDEFWSVARYSLRQ